MKTRSKIILQPQQGSQTLLAKCNVREILVDGNRGGGKSLGMIIKFLMYVGVGFGADWKGIIFRPESEPLRDIIDKTMKFVPRIFPKARYLKNERIWRFPEGETLRFGYGKTKTDAETKYLGNEFVFIGFEELTTWPDSEFYDILKTCLRSSFKSIPEFIISNTNPYGVGYAWVKKLFVDPDPIGGRIVEDKDGNKRVRIHSSLAENKILMDADPFYINNLKSIKNKARRKAWLFGSWDINAGGYFEEVWKEDFVIVEPFKIPSTWRIDRSLDWGTAKPFSVGWWAESDGTPYITEKGDFIPTNRGDLFRIFEFYGCVQGEIDKGINMPASTFAEKIKEYDEAVRLKYGIMVNPGPADTNIFGKDMSGETTPISIMRSKGVDWIKAKKGPNSRVSGWEVMLDYLDNSYTREGSGVFFFDNLCSDSIRIIPSLQRDQKNPSDIDTTQEDHIGDEIRYRLTTKKAQTTTIKSR